MSRLFNAAVGEPPNQVTARAARRQAIKRRIITCVSATAALAIAGSIGLVVSANAIVPHRVTGPQAKGTMPKFYFTEDGPSFLDRRHSPEFVVRSVSTGAITGRVHCPGPHPQTEGVAIASGRTFFIDCRIASPQDVSSGIRIYRFQVSASGKISRFGLIPGGNLVGFKGGTLAVTPDGSWLAMEAGKVVRGGIFEILVINTKTGASRFWRPDSSGRNGTFEVGSLSFVHGDKELAVSGGISCQDAGPKCKRDEEVRFLSPATKGGLFSSGKRRIITQAQMGGSGEDFITDAYVSQDGKTIIANVDGPKGIRVVELPAQGGKITRTLYQLGPKDGSAKMTVDSSGQFIMWLGFGPRNQFFGWIGQGKLHELKFKPENVNIFGW
ncbi:MAG TPA: hypothetical protein VFI65_13380 [Streptosporangiaceae bacterium]|nr:hypothetical protein [Streptosporangiaceae bacterium]